jgi:hypothetical protein
MSCLKDVPTLRGDNYTEWRKKVDLAFVCAEVDLVVDTPQPIKPTGPVRDAKDDDAVWDKKEKDHAPVEMAYVLENQKRVNANKKCMAFIKNTIENAIAGSIAECTSIGEFLEKIKSQFTAFKFTNSHFKPSIAFKIYDKSITMSLERFCGILGIPMFGIAKKMMQQPNDLLELYRGVTNDDKGIDNRARQLSTHEAR